MTERRLIQEKEALQEQLKVQEERAREATGRAAASAKAIVNVREALALLADDVNKTRLFDERLGREERLSRNKIIRFLVDQASSMEQTLEEMRTLAEICFRTRSHHPEMRRVSSRLTSRRPVWFRM